MKLTQRQLRTLIAEALAEESPESLAASLVNSIKRGRVSAEDLGNGEVYIMTGEEMGISVKVIGRGR